MDKIMKERVELLAPAGDWGSFQVAVENGADAVYLGGNLFNARENANNFNNKELKEALIYAHIRGVNVYLTLNTLISDVEMKDAVEFVKAAYILGIDGIIVQDLGVAGILKDLFPDLPLHASTQMTVYNLEGVRQLENLGFKRVVLARELSLEQIAYISDNTSMELEIFIHGALCISYSGQCLMSSMIGGRSGNRGKCAQPCRLPYDLLSSNNSKKGEMTAAECGGKYILSPKDLCSIKELDKIVNIGVKSLKIEGRMKSPEYVATVVRLYCKYLDSAYENQSGSSKKEVIIHQKDLMDLEQIFNRGGLYNGYHSGKTGKDMMCFEKPKNWGIYLGKVISYDNLFKTFKIKLEESLGIGDGVEVWNEEEKNPGTIITEIKKGGNNITLAAKGDVITAGSLKGLVHKGNKVYKTSDKSLNISSVEVLGGKKKKKISISGKIIINENVPMKLIVWDYEGNRTESVSAEIPERAVNTPITEERLLQQLTKTGSTPFNFDKIDIELGNNLSFPISSINNLRRKAIEELENKRAERYPKRLQESLPEIQTYFTKVNVNKSSIPKLSVLFYSLREDVNYSELKVERLYLPFSSLIIEKNKKYIEEIKSNNCELFAWLPPVTRGNYDALINSRMSKLLDSGIDGLLIGNIGHIEQVRQCSINRKLKLIADASMNVFNSYSIRELAELGIEEVTLSYELNVKQIEKLDRYIASELVIYGRIPLMTSEYCPVGSVLGGACIERDCNKYCLKGDNFALKDRKGVKFPVICDIIDCRSNILNSNILLLSDNFSKIINTGVEMVRLNITNEDSGTIKQIVDMHTKALVEGEGAFNQYAGLINKIKDAGFTKGHYFRGV